MATYTIPVTTTGDAGSATGSEQTALALPPCLIEAIRVDYHASAPATTTVVISEASGFQTVVTLATQKTDRIVYPRHVQHDEDGAEQTALDLVLVEGVLQVAVSGCDALDPAVTVTLRTVRSEGVH